MARKALKMMLLAGCVAGVAALGGCQSHPDMSPSPGFGDPYPAPLNDPQITVLSPELREWLGFHPATVIDDGKRPLHIEVPVRNLTDRQYLIEYRFIFFNEDGREDTPTMGWRFQPMDPKQLVRLTGSALDASAVAYRLEVRWSR